VVTVQRLFVSFVQYVDGKLLSAAMYTRVVRYEIEIPVYEELVNNKYPS